MDTHLKSKTLKRRYISTMFDILAPGYDAFTQVFSFGMDRGWKALLVREGTRRAARSPWIVDMACGTGDLGIDLAARTGAAFVMGLDLSPQMLAVARIRLREGGHTVSLVACDMLELCVGESRVDVVSIGYGLRNTADLGEGLREIARVLKPGGLLLNLDFYKPAGRLWRELFLWYMWNAGRAAGWLWHREPIVYGYIAPSIRRYVTMAEFEGELGRAGFAVEWRASRLGGGLGLHVARLAGKPVP